MQPYINAMLKYAHVKANGTAIINLISIMDAEVFSSWISKPVMILLG